MPRRPRPEPDLLNRDLTLVAFNGRVQDQAEDRRLPLLERLRFAGIVGSNLDEFFMVRAALARRNWRAGGPRTPDGLPPNVLLDRIAAAVRALFGRMHANLRDHLLPALEREGLRIVRPGDYTESDRAHLHAHFNERVLPLLSPLAVDRSHPFPLLDNGAIHLLLRVRPRADANAAFYGEANKVLLQVPRMMDRFVRLPAPKSGAVRVTFAEDLIAAFADEVMLGYVVLGAYPFRVLRDADVTVDEEQTEDLLTALEAELLRTRVGGRAVRVITGPDTPADIVHYIRTRCGLEERDVVEASGMLDMSAIGHLAPYLSRPDLRDPPWPPQPHPAFVGRDDLFAVLRQRDVLLSHPYQSFDPVVRMIELAADDPDTLAIKITLYRVSGKSPLVRALIRAAERGKQVVALVELRARFNERENIGWAKRLDAAGAHVIYGVQGYKTHSKACIVIRREQDGLRRYCHLGTGNYNDQTARQYTDLGYLTSRNAFGADLAAFFNVITGYSLPPPWQRIEMAPLGLRARTESLIRREIEQHRPETPGHIRAKMNALVDPALIRELYAASKAGVRVELLVRGMCSLRPGVPGLSEHITVRSIVDKFLEHPRIFHYRNGGADEVYLSSADWMERNMDKRLELLFPILDPECRAGVLRVLDAGFEDNVNAWVMDRDGGYARLSPAPGEPERHSQRMLYDEAVAAAKAAGAVAAPDGLFVAQTHPEEKRR